MLSKLLKELETEKEVNGFEKFKFSFLNSSRLEITAPSLPSAKLLEKVLYCIYHKLNYLLDYFDYQIKIKTDNLEISTNTIQEYFLLLLSTPFLWKKQEELIFFVKQKSLLEKSICQNNIVYLYFTGQHDLNSWRPKIIALKEMLGKIGLPNIYFALKKREELSEEISSIPLVKNNKSGLNKLPLLAMWKEKKLFELGVHTRFSTLDGINSPAEYVRTAQKKNYAALAVTDHYNVQSFPEFSKCQKGDLKIIYGCELEMLEDDLPSFIFNHSEELLTKKINELVYCVFDLETTGFFSQYNEILEIGYVIYRKGEIIREGEYLICPEKQIAPELLAAWYTSIDPQELKNAPKISEVLPLLQKDWEGCVLVAHNAQNFDYGFLNKVWKEHFKEELTHPILDTLPLSWILFPERKSYSLERLSQVPGRGRVSQTHRALEDSKLLAELLGKLIKNAKEKKINSWAGIKELVNSDRFPNRGKKIKILVCNQAGLNNLYQLVTLSHTKRLFRTPCVFRSDLIKYRSGLLIGAAGGREGEMFSLFSSFTSENKKREKMAFYDYIEINSPKTFRYLWLNGKIEEKELKEILRKIFSKAEEMNIPIISSHNVHHCESKEKILKEIIIANEGMNGIRHQLYSEATLEGKEDRFSYLPSQHLLGLEEIIDNWLFLNDKTLIEKIIFKYPETLVNKIGKVSIRQLPLNYSTTKSTRGEENDLVYAYTQKTNKLFGNRWPDFVQKRIEKEWEIIKGRYVFIYWLAYKVVQKTHQDGFIVGSRGSIGSSFIAYLCGITDLNPLPFYKYCRKCYYAKIYETKDRTYSCYDYQKLENCPQCFSPLTMEGHNLPFETFFGWEGEKTPDIDLNFSGEYQRESHNYVRQLLGEESVYRIGTINTLSEQTAEIFYKEHLRLRKELNSSQHLQKISDSETIAQWQKEYWKKLLTNQKDFKEEEWNREWIDWEKVKELQKQLAKARKEKVFLEMELKKLENSQQ